MFEKVSIIKMPQSSSSNGQSNDISKTRNSKEHDFVYSFRPFYFCSRAFGYMPFSIRFDSNTATYKPAPKALDILWFMISICLHILLAIAHDKFSEVKYSSSVVLIDGDFLVMIVSFIFGILIMVMDMHNRCKIVNILNKFKDSDEKVRSITTVIHAIIVLKLFFHFYFESR